MRYPQGILEHTALGEKGFLYLLVKSLRILPGSRSIVGFLLVCPPGLDISYRSWQSKWGRAQLSYRKGSRPFCSHYKTDREENSHSTLGSDKDQENTATPEH
jgi:hypothetical protein